MAKKREYAPKPLAARLAAKAWWVECLFERRGLHWELCRATALDGDGEVVRRDDGKTLASEPHGWCNGYCDPETGKHHPVPDGAMRLATRWSWGHGVQLVDHTAVKHPMFGQGRYYQPRREGHEDIVDWYEARCATVAAVKVLLGVPDGE